MLNNLIKEIIKESLLNEIGDASAKPYKWKLTDESDGYLVYTFKTVGGSKLNINVSFSIVWPVMLTNMISSDARLKRKEAKYYYDNPNYYWDTEFGISSFETDSDEDPNMTISSSEYRTDKSEIFRIMSTISEISRDLIKRRIVRGFAFKPATDSRAKLFLRYFKEQMPQAKVTQLQNGGIFITIDESVKGDGEELRHDGPNQTPIQNNNGFELSKRRSKFSRW